MHTYITEFPGHNPVDLRTETYLRQYAVEWVIKQTNIDTKANTHRRPGLKGPGRRGRRCAYPRHDGDDDVVEEGPQHHGPQVGMVTEQLPGPLGHHDRRHHPEDHQGVG